MNRCRNLAMRFVRHASRILPGAQTSWARAMRSEIAYIGNDPAALRWAFGCILASYKTRLSHWPWFSARTARRCAAAGAGLIFLGVVSFEGYASGQTVHVQSQINAFQPMQSRDRQSDASMRRPALKLTHGRKMP